MTTNEKLLLNLLEETKCKLISHEKRSEILVERSFDMILLVSPDRKILYVNPAIVSVLGYSAAEILQMQTPDLIHPDDRAALSEFRQEMMDIAEKSIFCQQRFLHKDGTWVWCEGTITNMLHEAGVNAFVFNFRDITERKENQKRLEESEKKFREFFENAPEGIIIFDVKSFGFIECNANALKLLKLSAEEILKKSPTDISPEFQPDGLRSDEKTIDLIQRTLNGERPVFEWQIINGEGELAIFEVRLVVLSDKNTPQLYASFVDITERKETEKKLQDQNKRLSEIAFIQSHRVRQPVANILGLINLFNFENLNAPLNAEVLLRLKTVTQKFDEIIGEIVSKTYTSESGPNF